MSNTLVKKILIVDDDENIHDIIKLIFEEEHYHIRGILNAGNLEETIANFLPDIILLDILIGQYDGREICNKLKHNPKTAYLPVILFSALNMDNLNCTPNDIIEKPFDIINLQEKVKALLNSNKLV
ncbi:response regulator [Pedobacter sp. MR2016-19]|uniref:response regulator n=1 Tax=Pedobacter sp. MR2016-19 TaxID=2780089 RepID=UPI001876E246|nr:response regulator [Pedobacter sp. MR2016-19]MBE5318959.1 response regulator [Pedobacter sp. MR2016-19]